MVAPPLTSLPVAWRIPALLLRSWRRWRPVGAGVLLSAVAIGAVGAGRAELTMGILLYAPPLVALAVMGGAFAHWRRPSVWTTIAQRRGAGPSDGWRLLALAAVLYLVCLLPIVGTALATLASAQGGAERALGRATCFGVAWGGISFLTVATVAVFLRRGVTGLTIVWMATPGLLAVVGPALELPKVVIESLAFLMPPFHSAALLHDVLTGVRPDLTERVILHLATYPLLCAGLIAFGLQRLLEAPDGIDP